MTITKQELESRLWDAANALRGPVDPADFKTYVFPMLFWKWISDTWAHEHNAALDEYGDDLDDEIEADFHRFEMPEGTLWSVVTGKVKNLGAEIARTFQRIEKANPRSLAGVFGDASWGNKERIPEPALLGLIKAFNQIRLDPSTVSHDLLGAGYEYLLKNFADESGKKAGEFFTPREVVNLLVGILQPEPGESVYDPTCGSGGMLVATINQLREAGMDHRTLRVYGQEINLTTASIARMNLFLHEIEDFDIKRGDTLRAPAFKDSTGTVRQFDAVIANPPFSLSNWGAERWSSDPRAICGVPPAKNGDLAFVQHMVSSMNPGTGRVGVVMPHGVLFRGGAEAKIRQGLVDKDLLEAVIGLPPNLFYSTAIPACLLIFRDQKPADRKDHILFIDGSARFDKGKNQNVMSEGDVEVLVEAYRTGEDPDGEGGAHVRLVPFDEIEENGFDLNIGRYIKVAAVETADLGTALVAYADARQHRIDAENAMFERLAAAGVDLSMFEASDE
ncbi:type I restriction-modification system subunit M [Arthrobacter bambusae]|uniref:site-specific DNA-methyltransferase (adenine-specific) n=1 Tax=Arthrobacter bambusae TaxID=1338426 RepID=A0AAW8DDW0_9MICC|nr:class I SAM-dependent DNA methyltransferase [Arthrobacter bambusae]MDP9904804.1 type I restriction enzyme M protein [Arthrobacter bambusae]MDQ0129620.1 type I restriction enzyme M protein [Arthrobacter bambusae]MDQ0180767.1 type I restriction enzyme M protein [Arthrobacter bambusae]